MTSPSMSGPHVLRRGLHSIVSQSAAPYGYTLTIWSSGAVLMHRHGPPSITDVFLFVAGALLAFSLLGLVAETALRDEPTVQSPAPRVLAGMLHWLAVGVAVGASALLSEISGWPAWPVGAFGATLAYLVIAGAQLGGVTHARGDVPR